MMAYRVSQNAGGVNPGGVARVSPQTAVRLNLGCPMFGRSWQTWGPARRIFWVAQRFTAAIQAPQIDGFSR